MKDKEKDKNSGDGQISYRVPIYLQLREIVRSKIEDGEYPPGTAIPSENELAETYKINRITVRNAVDALVKEGMLRRVQGKGVFVVGGKLEQPIEETGGFIPSLGKQREKVSIKEQTKVLRPAGDKYASLFGIAPEDLIYHIRQIVLAGGEPVSLEEVYVPHSVVPQLEAANSTVFRVHDIFAFYGVNVVSMRQNLEIVHCSEKLRHLLGVPESVAMVLLECTYENESGCVVEYTKSYSRGDKINFRVNLQKGNDKKA